MKFKGYKKTKYMIENKNYFEELERKGCTLNKKLKKISIEEMELFLNDNYTRLVIVDKYNYLIKPILACALVSSNKNLLESLEKHFEMKVKITYGYIQIKEQSFHEFGEDKINAALERNIYFDNHHAWIQFENGQLLDLNFINSLKYAKEVLLEEYEFILADASKVIIPHIISKWHKLNKKSFFNYRPLYCGNLFSEEMILANYTLKTGL